MITIKISRHKKGIIKYSERLLKERLEAGCLYLYFENDFNLSEQTIAPNKVLGTVVDIKRDYIEIKPSRYFFECMEVLNNYNNYEAFVHGAGKNNKILKIFGIVFGEKYE